MSAVGRALLVLLAAASVGMTADPTVQQLYQQARDKVIDNLKRTPRYTCVQNITRTAYAPPLKRGASCASLIAARRQDQGKIPGAVLWRDRIRLDVGIVNGAEMFSWAGAGKFQTNNIEDLIPGGVSGNGDFAAFLLNVFDGDADRTVYQGLQTTATGPFARFSYLVSPANSQYTYRSSGPGRITGYSGAFLVDSHNGDLQQLTVETDELPADEAACEVDDTMDYHRVTIGDGDFTLPEVASMDVLFRNGATSHNETVYSGCREFAGETTIQFGDADVNTAPGNSGGSTRTTKAALPPLPPHTQLRISLSKPIDAATAAAGDEVASVLLFDVKDRSGTTLVRRNDPVHGRILQMEQSMDPIPHWIVAIRFDRIEDNGRSETVSLRPLDDGSRISARQLPPGLIFRPFQIPVERPGGTGVFLFPGGNNEVIGTNFQSRWETN